MADPEVSKADDKNDENVPENTNKCTVEQEERQNVKPGPTNNCTDIDDLDELLDSALADFGKPIVPPKHNLDASSSASASGKDGAKPQPKRTNKKKPSPKRSQDDMFNEIFDEAELQNAAQEAMKAFSGDDPAMFEQFQKFMSETQGAGGASGGEDKFMESLKEAMTAMSENAQDIQTEDLGDDDLVKALNDMGLNMSDASDDNFDPLIENMMKNLLSKEVLYPSMQKINEVYPAWLEKHGPTLSTEQRQTYVKQHELINEICAEFESELEADNAETKKRRFDRVYTLMQEMQECGQPPPEIVKELAPGMTLDSNGMPRLAGMDGQCTLM